VDLEKLDYDLSRGPWFFDPNVKFGIRTPEDAQDKQLMKAVEVLKSKIGSTATPLPEEVITKIVDLDKKYSEKKTSEDKKKDKKDTNKKQQ
jgi:hypothetical protein